MRKSSSYCVGYITVPTLVLARKIATVLIEEKLVACANIFPGVESLYWWDDKVQKDKEVILLVKTTEKHAQKITHIVQDLHTYHCPCITFAPLIDGSGDFFAWMDEELK